MQLTSSALRLLPYRPATSTSERNLAGLWWLVSACFLWHLSCLLAAPRNLVRLVKRTCHENLCLRAPGPALSFKLASLEGVNGCMLQVSALLVKTASYPCWCELMLTEATEAA